MQLELTEDQEFFAGTTRRFINDRYPPSELRAIRDEPRGFDPDYWRQGADLGWTSLLVDESLGGGSISGRGLVDLALLAYEFGRHASPGPLLGTNVCAAALSRWGSSEQRNSLLPGILAGDVTAAIAFSEPSPQDRLGTVTCRAIPDAKGMGFRLSGTKAPIEAGGQADVLLVAARTPQGVGHFLVPTGATGVDMTPMRSIDVSRRFASAHFTDVELSNGSQLGSDASSDEPQHDELLRIAIVIQLAEMVGAVDRCLEMTTAWAFDRYSFGRPLASYQALKHRFADMRAWVEAAHAISDAATEHVQDGSPRAEEFLSAAKIFMGTYAPEIAQDCIQLHGGIGVTFDHDLHLYLRRIVLGSRLLGTVTDHQLRLASFLATSGGALVRDGRGK